MYSKNGLDIYLIVITFFFFFFPMRISSLFADFCLTMCQLSRAHHEEAVNMSWVDWCGKMLKDRKIVNAGFVLTTHGLLVQEHNYSATTLWLIDM